MNFGIKNQLTLDGFPSAGIKSSTYKIDALVVKVGSKTYGIDGICQAKFSRTYGIDALVQGGSTKFYSIDAILATPYHNNGAWGRTVDIDLVAPIDEQRLPVWSTYSRPASPIDGMHGRNSQTGKIEYWDATAGIWKLADGSSA